MNSDSIKTPRYHFIINFFYRTETSGVVNSVESFRPCLLVVALFTQPSSGKSAPMRGGLGNL